MDPQFGSSAATHLQQHREPEHDEPGGEEQRHHASHARDGQLQQRHKGDHQQARSNQEDLQAGGERGVMREAPHLVRMIGHTVVSGEMAVPYVKQRPSILPTVPHPHKGGLHLP